MKILGLFSAIVALAKCDTLLHKPLDERFTTRNAFLNLAKATPFNVVTQVDPGTYCLQEMTYFVLANTLVTS